MTIPPRRLLLATAALLTTTIILETTALTTTALATPKLVPGKWFDRIIIINLENTDYTDAARQAYFRTLYSRRGVLLSNYHAIAHPSLPNYVSQTYGSTYNITDDEIHDVAGTNIVDALERKGVSWRTYQENLPSGECFAGGSATEELYSRKHNPFVMFDSVRGNATRCRDGIKNATVLLDDIRANAVPQYVFYTPNQNNNGHDTTPRFAANWVEAFLADKLADPRFNSPRTLIFLTFDEREYYIENTDYNNHIATILFGGAVRHRAGQIDATPHNHYSLLRTVEENWGLGSLKRNDADASVIDITGTKGYVKGRGVFEFVQPEEALEVREKRETKSRDGGRGRGRGAWALTPEALI